ncbi:MAG: GntR family transcriptional regulator [Firmicutes bacterium]|nr:GntR family transcriptional regulator [Bacillota bacterium]
MGLPNPDCARAVSISSRAELVYKSLRDDILRNRLRPGERLSEERIGRQLQVSRTPVREALKRLHAEGLVEITPHRGAVVRDPSGEDLAELCAVREVLEGLSGRLAAKAISSVELYTLEQLIEEMDRTIAGGNLDELIELNFEFHHTIWVASRNRYLVQQLRQLRQFIFRLQDSSLKYSARTKEAQEEHRALFQAIQAGDPDEAERLAREHFRKSEMVRIILWHRARYS